MAGEDSEFVVNKIVAFDRESRVSGCDGRATQRPRIRLIRHPTCQGIRSNVSSSEKRKKFCKTLKPNASKTREADAEGRAKILDATEMDAALRSKGL